MAENLTSSKVGDQVSTAEKESFQYIYQLNSKYANRLK